MGFSDLVLVHNGGFLLRNHLAFAMKENDGADRLALGQNLLRTQTTYTDFADPSKPGQGLFVLTQPRLHLWLSRTSLKC